MDSSLLSASKCGSRPQAGSAVNARDMHPAQYAFGYCACGACVDALLAKRATLGFVARLAVPHLQATRPMR